MPLLMAALNTHTYKPVKTLSCLCFQCQRDVVRVIEELKCSSDSLWQKQNPGARRELVVHPRC